MFRLERNRCLDRRKSCVVLGNLTNLLSTYLTVILLTTLLHIVTPSPLGGSFAPPRKLQIKDKKCYYALNGRSVTGHCMFNFQCYQQGGIVLGTCIDGFLFGACCSFASKNTNYNNAYESHIADKFINTEPTHQSEGVMIPTTDRKSTKHETTTTNKPFNNQVNNFIEQDTWVTEIYSVYHIDDFRNKMPNSPNQINLPTEGESSNVAELISHNMIESHGGTLASSENMPNAGSNESDKHGYNIPPESSTIPISYKPILHKVSENSQRNEIIIPSLSESSQSLHLANHPLVVAPRKNASHWVLISSSVVNEQETIPEISQPAEGSIMTTIPYTEFNNVDDFNKIPSDTLPSTESLYHETNTFHPSIEVSEVILENATLWKTENKPHTHENVKYTGSSTSQKYATSSTPYSMETITESLPITQSTMLLNVIYQNDKNNPNVMPIIFQLQGTTNNTYLPAESIDNWVTTNIPPPQSIDQNLFKNENYFNEDVIQTTEGDLLFWTTRSPLVRQSATTSEKDTTILEPTSPQKTSNDIIDTTSSPIEDTTLSVETSNIIQTLINKEPSLLTTNTSDDINYEENLITDFVKKTSLDHTFNNKLASTLPSTGNPESEVANTPKPPLDVNMLIQLLNLTNYVPEVGYVIPASLIPSTTKIANDSESNTTETSIINITEVDSGSANASIANSTLVTSNSPSAVTISHTTTYVPKTHLNDSDVISTVSFSKVTKAVVSIGSNNMTTTESYLEATSIRSDVTNVVSSSNSSTDSTTTTTTKPLFNWDWRTTCGVRPLVREGRIVNGRKSDFGEWPWQALIRESTWLGIFTKNKCGGVLLTEKYVLTAAHCQPGFLASLIVILGELDVGGDYEPKDNVQRNVKRVIVHKDFISRTFDNDLALLELEKPVTFDEHILPICLPQGNDDFVGKIGYVSGWGRLSYQGEIPQKLHNVQVPVVPNLECQDWFREAGHSKIIKPEFICAGYKLGKKDSCEGDSGGPLSMRAEDGRWFLAGIVSHGIKCAFPNLPGVYMRMTYYRPWIEQVINR